MFFLSARKHVQETSADFIYRQINTENVPPGVDYPESRNKLFLLNSQAGNIPRYAFRFYLPPLSNNHGLRFFIQKGAENNLPKKIIDLKPKSGEDQNSGWLIEQVSNPLKPGEEILKISRNGRQYGTFTVKELYEGEVILDGILALIDFDPHSRTVRVFKDSRFEPKKSFFSRPKSFLRTVPRLEAVNKPLDNPLPLEENNPVTPVQKPQPENPEPESPVKVVFLPQSPPVPLVSKPTPVKPLVVTDRMPIHSKNPAPENPPLKEPISPPCAIPSFPEKKTVLPPASKPVSSETVQTKVEPLPEPVPELKKPEDREILTLKVCAFLFPSLRDNFTSNLKTPFFLLPKEPTNPEETFYPAKSPITPPSSDKGLLDRFTRQLLEENNLPEKLKNAGFDPEKPEGQKISCQLTGIIKSAIGKINHLLTSSVNNEQLLYTLTDEELSSLILEYLRSPYLMRWDIFTEELESLENWQTALTQISQIFMQLNINPNIARQEKPV